MEGQVGADQRVVRQEDAATVAIRPVSHESDIGQRGPAASRGAQAATFSINAATRKVQIAQIGASVVGQIDAITFAIVAGGVGIGSAGSDDEAV